MTNKGDRYGQKTNNMKKEEGEIGVESEMNGSLGEIKLADNTDKIEKGG